MRILHDFKIPNFKFPKFKMEGLEKIEEVNLQSDSVKNVESRNDKRNYEPTTYKTIKEIFNRSTDMFGDRPFILEKLNHKDEAFSEITYREFRADVIGLGTGLDKYLHLNGKPIVIIGENTYFWYVSYMTMLCSDGIAVPVDKELPPNEIENLLQLFILRKKKKLLKR